MHACNLPRTGKRLGGTGNEASVHTAATPSGPADAPHTLAVCQARTFAGVPDPLALVPAAPFGGFFVLPAASELPKQPGFLQLPFQQPQGKLDIVLMHQQFFSQV